MKPGHVVPLPRGRHALTRDQVVMSQRLRMLDAMARAVAEKGYVKTTVADVIKGAGVSRETFYEQFADKEACFLAAYDTGVELMFGAIGGALAQAQGDPLDGFDRALAAYLETLAGEPAIARTALVEIYAAGPDALARRMELQTRFVETIAAVLGAEGERERFACEALVAAISALVTTRVATGRTAELPQLHAPLMDLVREVAGALRAGRQGGAASA